MLYLNDMYQNEENNLNSVSNIYLIHMSVSYVICIMYYVSVICQLTVLN